MFGFQFVKLDLKVWVGSDEGWVNGGGSVRTRTRDGSVRMRDGSAEGEDKGWISGVACMRRWGCVSRGGFGHHRQYPLLARLGLGMSDFWSSLGFLFELSLSLSLSSDFQSVKLSFKVNQVCN